VDVDPSAIARPEPTPPQTMQGMGALAVGTTTTVSSEGTSLTLENMERMMEQVTAPYPQSQIQSNAAAAELQLRREATRQRAETRDDVEMTPVPVPPEEAIKMFPKDKNWEKLYRSRKPVEEKVSHILLHSQNRIGEIQKTLDDMENRHRNTRKVVREATKQTKDLQRDIRELKKRKNELKNETEEKKKLRATRIIQDVLALPKIRKVEVDEKKRIFITTDEMEVVKDYWDKPRVAGQYQILVDFYETGIGEGVRVLNITRRLLDQYDHPCINRTKPCWGNIKKEMEENFKEQDLLEIVITMLLYISSPNDDTGYIEYSKKPPTERHKQGWEQFLEFATPCPKNLSFRKYEKKRESRIDTGPIGTPFGTLTTPDLRYATTTLGSMANTSRFTPPQPSRLPPLSIPRDITNNASFTESFMQHIRRIIEFRDPETAAQIMRLIMHSLERSGIIFIKEIRYIPPEAIEINGWTTEGWRIERISVPIREIHSREIMSLRFDPPSWFRDIGRPEGMEYYNQDMQRVPVVASNGTETNGYYSTGESTTGGSV